MRNLKLVWLKIPAVLMQASAILIMQWLLPVSWSPLAATGHAPLEECAMAGCACCASHAKGAKCCCTQEAHAAQQATAKSSSDDPFTIVIRAAQCSGDGGSPSISTAKCETVLPQIALLPPFPRDGFDVLPVLQNPQSLTFEPPHPPPRHFSLA